ncbi:hypothetical protein QKC54_gp0384 [Megavirus baoshan]|uniref:Uncharacterized protein n=1 Tax=Megavirus baoshan TaxID=2496520 RepID=A0A3S8UXF3_9VIRU|nr:hypothetical protein QKC54_gp0384 [Megavirus baoshan]AZL89441.1 hypothetical protein Mb0688 [Megavirus baoshan]
MKLLYFLLLIFLILIIVIIYYDQKQKKTKIKNNKLVNIKSENLSQNISQNLSQNKYKNKYKNKSKNVSQNVSQNISQNKFIDLVSDTDEYYNDDTNNIYNLINEINNRYSIEIEFNMANNPVIGQIDKNLSSYFSQIVTRKLKNDINQWNHELFHNQNKIILSETVILNLKATTDEFIVELLSHFFIEKQDYYVELCYYGKKNSDIDFFSNNNNIYIISMCNIEMSDNDTYLEAINKNNTESNVFMTMSEQMKYVNKINIMHREEME